MKGIFIHSQPIVKYFTAFVIQAFVCFSSLCAQTFEAEQIALPASLNWILKERIHNDFEVFNIEIDSMNTYAKDNSDSLSFELEIANYSWQVHLKANQMRSSSSSDTNTINTYRGYVNSDTNNICNFYISENFIRGYLLIDTMRYHITALTEFGEEFSSYSQAYILTKYSNSDTYTPSGTCDNPIVHIGIMADKSFVESNFGGDNYLAHEQIISIMADMESFYRSELDIPLRLQLELHDLSHLNGPSGPKLSHIGANNVWRFLFPCIEVDAIFIFTNKYFHPYGQATDIGLCTDGYGDVSAAVVSFYPSFLNPTLDPTKFDVPRYYPTVAHELGHLLGMGELENSSCSEECLPENDPSPLMCSDGGGSTFESRMFLSDCTITSLRNAVEGLCEVCLEEPDPVLCPNCMEDGRLTYVHNGLVPGCAGQDEIEIIANFSADCDGSENVKLEVKYNANYVEITDLGDFTSTTVINGNSYVTSEYQNLSEEEVIEMRFKARITGVPSSYFVGFGLYAYEEHSQSGGTMA